MDDAIRYAGEHRMMISLETHNEKNMAFYAHFGFKVFGIVEKGMGLKQYCLVREKFSNLKRDLSGHGGSAVHRKRSGNFITDKTRTSAIGQPLRSLFYGIY